MKKNEHKPGMGKFEGFLIRTANIKGFTVLELTHPEQARLGLAFCSPMDRMKGKFSREEGCKIAFKRMMDPEHQLPHHDGWSVQRAVLDAVVHERQGVPWEIADVLLGVLHDEKAPKGPKPVWGTGTLWERVV